MAPHEDDFDDGLSDSDGRPGMQPSKRAHGLKLRLAQVRRPQSTTKRKPSLPPTPWDKKPDVTD